MTDLRQQLEDAWTSAMGESETQSAEPQTNVATSEDNQTAPAEPVEVITAPNSYTKEMKDNFHTLSSEWQKYLSAREKEYEQGLSRARNQYSWVDKYYNDRKDALTAQGYNNAQEYLNDLVLLSDVLEKDPRAAISALQAQFGIETGANDNALQRQLNAVSQKLTEQQRYLDAQRQERLKSEYDAFVNAKDDKGNSKHPYFEDVRGEMANLVGAGLAKNFEDAYNQAVWRVESVRNKIIANQAGASVQEKASQALKAKTASFEPQSKTEGQGKKLSLREELERNYDNLMEN